MEYSLWNLLRVPKRCKTCRNSRSTVSEKLPLYPNSTSQSEAQGVQILKSYLCTQAQQIRQEELLLEYYAERALPSLREEAND